MHRKSEMNYFFVLGFYLWGTGSKLFFFPLFIPPFFYSFFASFFLLIPLFFFILLTKQWVLVKNRIDRVRMMIDGVICA